MRLRVRGPNGATTVTMSDGATVGELRSEIRFATQLTDFDLKAGYPPRPLEIDSFSDDLLLAHTGLTLDGQQMTVTKRAVASKSPQPPSPHAVTYVPQPARGATSSASSVRKPISSLTSSSNSSLPSRSTPNKDDPPEIPMMSLQGTLVLRVMPDDNSCLFRALSYAVLGDIDQMHELRGTVAREIKRQPDVYTDAILEKPVNHYCDWIQRPNSWGGAVEISILSQHFGLEIISVNVEDLRIDRFNEGQPNRCILVYSGIHYDCIALNPSDWPFEKANADPDEDQRTFSAHDDAPVQGALQICSVLKQRNYFVNTNSFSILCGVCGWRGKGEKEAIKHAEETNHNDFEQA